jgi:hypothetical protein
MKLAKAVLGSLVLAAVPLAAQAEGISYSYAELDYIDVNLDPGPSGDGFALRGSVGFGGNYFVFADLAQAEIDVVDVDNYAVGLGGHFNVAPSVDFVGRIGYTEVDLSAPGFGSASDDGYLLSAGLRGQMERFEMEGHVVYTDLSDGGDETAVEVAGRYNFSEMFSAGIAYRFGDDADTLFAGVRLSW